MTNLNFGGNNEDALTGYPRGVGYRFNAQPHTRPKRESGKQIFGATV